MTKYQLEHFKDKVRRNFEPLFLTKILELEPFAVMFDITAVVATRLPEEVIVPLLIVPILTYS